MNRRELLKTIGAIGAIGTIGLVVSERKKVVFDMETIHVVQKGRRLESGEIKLKPGIKVYVDHPKMPGKLELVRHIT